MGNYNGSAAGSRNIGGFTPFVKQRNKLEDEQPEIITYKYFRSIQIWRAVATVIWIAFAIALYIFWHKAQCQTRLAVHHSKIMAVDGDQRRYEGRTWAMPEWPLISYLIFMAAFTVMIYFGALLFTVNEFNMSVGEMGEENGAVVLVNNPISPGTHWLLAFNEGISWAMVAHLSGVISWAGLLFAFFWRFTLEFIAYFIERKRGTVTEWVLHVFMNFVLWVIIIIQFVYDVEDENHTPRYPRFWLGIVITQLVKAAILWIGFTVWFWTSNQDGKRDKPGNYKYLTVFREVMVTIGFIVFFSLYTWGIFGDINICG